MKPTGGVVRKHKRRREFAADAMYFVAISIPVQNPAQRLKRWVQSASLRTVTVATQRWKSHWPRSWHGTRGSDSVDQKRK